MTRSDFYASINHPGSYLMAELLQKDVILEILLFTNRLYNGSILYNDVEVKSIQIPRWEGTAGQD